MRLINLQTRRVCELTDYKFANPSIFTGCNNLDLIFTNIGNGSGAVNCVNNTFYKFTGYDERQPTLRGQLTTVCGCPGRVLDLGRLARWGRTRRSPQPAGDWGLLDRSGYLRALRPWYGVAVPFFQSTATQHVFHALRARTALQTLETSMPNASRGVLWVS